MKSNHSFYTRTLGNLYLKQDYLEDAEIAFRKILDQDPENEALMMQINDIQKMVAEKRSSYVNNLIMIWSDLLRKEKELMPSYAKGPADENHT